MAIALVAHVSVASGGNNVTTSAIDTSGSTLIVAYIAEKDSATDAVLTDSKSNTWQTDITERKDVGINLLGRMFYAINPTVGSGHTFTVTSSSGNPSICVATFSGTATASPLDQQNGNVDVDAGLSNTTGSITPSEDNCLVITGLGFQPNSATISIDGSYVITDQVDVVSGTAWGTALAYIVQTSLAASNRTWTYSSNEYAVTSIASFKSGGGGGGGGAATRDLTTLLCGQ